MAKPKAAAKPQPHGNRGRKWPFRGLCISAPSQADLPIFNELIANVLPACGCNTLVLLIRYTYQFQRHPEVGNKDGLSPQQAAAMGALCRQHGIRLIPKMNLLGHQSGKERGQEDGLLRAHPEFDETPDAASVRYCRSLCPRHPDVARMVCDLGDELLEAFQADAIHIGCDEVFEIGLCPRCRGTPNHVLFADWISQLHAHFVKTRKVELLMWSDRFLDGQTTGYGEWEASQNDTWNALDKVPKDLILCDWHYGKRDSYPSLERFAANGFRHVVSPWRDLAATQALLEFAATHGTDRFLGVLATSWCDPGAFARYLCHGGEAQEIPKGAADCFKLAMAF